MRPSPLVLLTRTLITAIIFLVFNSCHPMDRLLKKARYDYKVVPEDFNPSKYTLLVDQIGTKNDDNGYTKSKTEKLRKYLEQYYPYPFEIVPRKDILSPENSKYDTSKYRFGITYKLDYDVHTTVYTYSNGATREGASARTFYMDFRFYDRAREKQYPPTGNRAPSIESTVRVWTELINRTMEDRRLHKKTK